MKQDYTMAYLRYLADKRKTIPPAHEHRCVKTDPRETRPLTAKEARDIRDQVDILIITAARIGK